MLSDVIALGATAICCTSIGWAVVVLTSTRRERLGQRFGFRARRWSVILAAVGARDITPFDRIAGRPWLVGDGRGFSLANRLRNKG